MVVRSSLCLDTRAYQIYSSMTIQNLRQAAGIDEAVVYCFFDYAMREELTAETVLAELLLQIFIKDVSKFRDIIVQLYDAAEAGRRKPTLDELSSAFRTSCKRLKRTSVLVDALDESDHVTRRRLLSALDLAANENCRLLVTSRPHIQSSAYLNRLSIEMIEIDIQAHCSDLQLFLDSRIADCEDLELVVEGCEGGAQGVINQIINQAGFRYASTLYLASFYLLTSQKFPFG